MKASNFYILLFCVVYKQVLSHPLDGEIIQTNNIYFTEILDCFDT